MAGPLYVPESNKYPRTFESVTDGVSRLKVPNGWIVVVGPTSGEAVSSFFVIDADHKWELEPNGQVG